MRNNELTVFQWMQAYPPNTERRDYPICDASLILAMTDLVWSPPYGPDSSHCHNCMEIGLCIAGSGSIRIGKAKSRPFIPGTVVIVPEGVHHSQQNEGQPNTRWRYIAVDQALLLRESPGRCREEIEALIQASANGVYLFEQEITEDIAWLIQKMFEIKCKFADESTAELEALLLLILTRIAREPHSFAARGQIDPLTAQPVEPALLFIAEHYRAEIKVSQLARCCAMSESHFRKVFVQHMGVTPIEYLNRYRIDRAVNMIRMRGGDPISHIAEECGFASIATFNRNFLRYVGQNPSEMKKENAHR